MKKGIITLLLGGLIAPLTGQHLHHDIEATISHASHEITVSDRLTFPAGWLHGSQELIFTLNKALGVDPPGGGIRIEKLAGDPGSKVSTYRVKPLEGWGKTGSVTLHYSGRIHEEIQTGAAEYARGFSETDGIIGDDGIYLAGSTNWIPSMEDAALFTFELSVEMDKDWLLVSQGTRTKDMVADGRRRTVYQSPEPMDEVFLIAGKWTEYSRQSGNVLVQVFLRTPDGDLARRYMGVTSHYLSLYERLIGDYPYSKFALVENFWETGYGMPSFTLLGPQVIRFPWILHSSYPHELLHNYWGNSVYVDYASGNWCEGITAYMADHLIKEQQGQAVEYRRNTLQKFTDYVNAENDFPPVEFVSRNNPAEEAIGYGKVLMFNNMLREEFGDESFLESYSDFYENKRFCFASFGDIRTSFEKVTGKDLEGMFSQWLERKGAPSLVLSEVSADKKGEEYELSFSLAQVQEGAVFRISVPVAVYLEDREVVFLTHAGMEEREKRFTYSLDSRPLKVSIDPQFQLMRFLDRSEVPSTLSQLFGAQASLVLVPARSEFREEYRALGEFWKATQEAQGKQVEILTDEELAEFPADRPVWVFGFENQWAGQVRISDGHRSTLTEADREMIDSLAVDQSLVYALPSAGGQTLGFVGSRHREALEALGRKLFHYGSYGYLGFEGPEATNVLKGTLPVLDSSLDHVIPWPDRPAITQKLPERKALGQEAP
jgi:aminopeptidase N